ncbi:MAG: hypothetical protein AMXMBFR33_50220 [Candidatus Xenobia bacterium]
MSKPTTFGALLRQLRRQSGLTQAQLAERSRSTQQRISRLESNFALAGREECVRLADVLQTEARELMAKVRRVGPRSPLNSLLTDDRACYTPPCEKSGVERYRAGMARCPGLLGPLWQSFDLPQQTWLESAPTDSLEEWMVLVHRVAAGLRPTFCAPLKLGIRMHPVVDWLTGEAVGDLAYPALVGQAAGMRQALIPQLCLRPVKTAYRLDFALVVLVDRRRFVIDGEVDGTGHRSGLDRFRARELRLPELRFAENLVFQSDFNELFDVRLRRLLPLRQP